MRPGIGMPTRGRGTARRDHRTRNRCEIITAPGPPADQAPERARRPGNAFSALARIFDRLRQSRPDLRQSGKRGSGQPEIRNPGKLSPGKEGPKPGKLSELDTGRRPRMPCTREGTQKAPGRTEDRNTDSGTRDTKRGQEGPNTTNGRRNQEHRNGMPGRQEAPNIPNRIVYHKRK